MSEDEFTNCRSAKQIQHMKIATLLLVLVALLIVPIKVTAQQMRSPDIVLSLAWVTNSVSPRFEIRAQNVSSNNVVLTQDGAKPTWLPQIWFDWEVDGLPASLSIDAKDVFAVMEIARGPQPRARQIAAGEIVQWGTVRVKDLVFLHAPGAITAILDGDTHTIVIKSGPKWSDVVASPGRLVVFSPPKAL